MTAGRPQEVRRQSIRVALAATGIVAVVYLVVSVAVVAIVDRNLTAQIDAQLTAALHRSISEPFPGGGGGNGGGGGGYFPPPDSDRPGGLPFLTWTVRSDGTVFAPASNPDLPAEYVAGDRSPDGDDRRDRHADRRSDHRRGPRDRRPEPRQRGPGPVDPDPGRAAASRRCSCWSSSWAPWRSAGGSPLRSPRPAGASWSSRPTPRTSCEPRCR